MYMLSFEEEYQGTSSGDAVLTLLCTQHVARSIDQHVQ